MAARATQVALEVLRTTANTYAASGSTTITFTPTGTQHGAFVAAASTLVLLTPLGQKNASLNVNATHTVTFFASCGQTRNAEADASTTITFSPSSSQVRVTSSDGETTVTLSTTAAQVRDIPVNASSTFTLSPSSSQVRDIPIAGSSAFAFSDLAHEVTRGPGAFAQEAIEITDTATATKTAIAHASVSVTLSESGTGVQLHHPIASSQISFTTTPAITRVIEISATTRFRLINSIGVGQSAAIGGNPMASQYVGYLGQYQLGQILPLTLRAVGYQGRIVTPDTCPTATIYADDGSSQVVSLPAIDKANAIFSLPILLGLTFSLGRYRVAYRYVSAGEVKARVDYFEVIPGGDPGGAIISIFACDRPESSYVLAQLSSGKLIQGRRPQF